MNAPLLVPPKRCAVYCRVSSDERLDQSFNSIDAQKEAGHAFIKSQACEGWIAVGDDYDAVGRPLKFDRDKLYVVYDDNNKVAIANWVDYDLLLKDVNFFLITN